MARNSKSLSARISAVGFPLSSNSKLSARFEFELKIEFELKFESVQMKRLIIGKMLILHLCLQLDHKVQRHEMCIDAVIHAFQKS